MLWGNNKKEIEEMQKKVDKAISDICLLQHTTELLKTNQNSLRGLVNRKIGGVKEEEAIKEETENNIKPNIFLTPNGTAI